MKQTGKLHATGDKFDSRCVGSCLVNDNDSNNPFYSHDRGTPLPLKRVYTTCAGAF